MSGHQYTADMVNNELNQFQEMQEGSLDSIMAQTNPNPDFSIAQEIHCSLETNTEISDFSGHGLNSVQWTLYDKQSNFSQSEKIATIY